MIDEKFLKAASNIRRTYLKVSNNMGLYKDKVESTVKKLDDTIKKIESIQKSINSKDNNENTNSVLAELLKILTEVEQEGKSLEEYINPLNREIEILAIEEQELYRQITEKHNNLSEEEIVNYVKNRLESEDLL